MIVLKWVRCKLIIQACPCLLHVVFLQVDMHVHSVFFCISTMYSSVQPGDISIFQLVKDERLKREQASIESSLQRIPTALSCHCDSCISANFHERGREKWKEEKRKREKKRTTNNSFHHLSLLFCCLVHGSNSVPISDQSNSFFNEMGFMD